MARDMVKITSLMQLVLDNRLQQLREAAEARDQSLMQMAAVTAAAAPADLPAVTAGIVGLTYQRWADVRRAELNTVIARQTADWMAAKSAASLAFGRAQAVRGIAERLQAK